MTTDNIVEMAKFFLEPVCWVNVSVKFLKRHSDLSEMKLIGCIEQTIIKSPTTLGEIFECCLFIYEWIPDIKFNEDFFELLIVLACNGSLKTLSTSGINGQKAGDELRKIILRINNDN